MQVRFVTAVLTSSVLVHFQQFCHALVHQSANICFPPLLELASIYPSLYQSLIFTTPRSNLFNRCGVGVGDGDASVRLSNELTEVVM
jgi:hypothetical protein